MTTASQPQQPGDVRITSVDVPFWSLFTFTLKWSFCFALVSLLFGVVVYAVRTMIIEFPH